jgi:hypothetical protein
MKSQQLYSTLGEHLAPVCKAYGFKRSKTVLSWVRPRGELYKGFWCQADQRGWDTYAGSKFVAEFQLGHEPLIGWNTVCRQRIRSMSSAQGDGNTLSMLLNSVFALPAFKKAATPVTFPSLACCIQIPAIFLSFFTWP